MDLDLARAVRDSGDIIENVVQHLQVENGVEVRVTVDIRADFPEGAEERTVRTVSENCRVLRFKDFGFEER